jgi:hypothetical protein
VLASSGYGGGLYWTSIPQLQTQFNGGTIYNVLVVSNSTVSNNPTSGGLLVTGGVGIAGNVSIGGRIFGDFSNATSSQRVSFQSTTTNGYTIVQAIPNGTNNTSSFRARNKSDIDNSSYLSIGVTSSTAELRSDVSGSGAYLPITMHTNGTERVRILNNGNVGVGIQAPIVPFHTVGNARVDGGLFVNGDIYATGVVIPGYSDARLKQVIGPIAAPLDIIASLTGVRYVPNQLAYDLGLANDNREQIGIIAQDAQALLSQIVSKIPLHNGDYLTVQYDRITAVLIEAIKELQAKIENLESIISDFSDKS